MPVVVAGEIEEERYPLVPIVLRKWSLLDIHDSSTKWKLQHAFPPFYPLHSSINELPNLLAVNHIYNHSPMERGKRHCSLYYPRKRDVNDIFENLRLLN